MLEEENYYGQYLWYRALFEYAADAMLVVQPETWSVLDANVSAEQLFGITIDELLGMLLPEFRVVYEALQQSASQTVLCDISIKSKDSSDTVLSLEVSARYVPFDGKFCILATARDVREQRALSDRMVHADKMMLLGQLSAGIAHEIRNPLAAINLNLQLLQRKIAPNAPERTMITSALQGVDRITRIVEGTLNFSRAARPVTKLETINTVVMMSLDLLTHTLKRKTIAVNLHLDRSLPPIPIDTMQMQQVLINLLSNAIDAIKIKGTLSVETFAEPTPRGDGHFVVVKICDDGCGMSESDLEQIFTPFFTKKTDGTGLGLPISRKIIESHGGFIEVTSQLGEGSVFMIKLPMIS